MAKKEFVMNFNFDSLTTRVAEANNIFTNIVQKQVNSALTMRNWLVGYHIVQYEQSGEDRAVYGDQTLIRLAQKLKDSEVPGVSATNLKLFRQFYITYPHIGQTVSDFLRNHNIPLVEIGQTVSDQFAQSDSGAVSGDLLFNRLSFSHIVELLKSNSAAQRAFYESEVIKNAWSVRELQRSMNSLLYERTGLSSVVPIKQTTTVSVTPEDVFRNEYVLEFLGLKENREYSESDLEQSIIDNLQNFLIEMGKGFCFEARQKRITFDNTHYRVDLVFYHRILKCHVLIDLKIGEFSHADSGQMNVYLNYYRENEMSVGDAPPIGIILCSGQNDTLVRYATSGLPHKVFVSKYLIDLPSEDRLRKLVAEGRQKLQS